MPMSCDDGNPCTVDTCADNECKFSVSTGRILPKIWIVMMELPVRSICENFQCAFEPTGEDVVESMQTVMTAKCTRLALV